MYVVHCRSSINNNMAKANELSMDLEQRIVNACSSVMSFGAAANQFLVDKYNV